MKFAITGHGRSGTNFLASLMNKSEFYEVEHEPLNGKYIDYSDYFNSKSGNYGMVNNRLRWHFCDLPVRKFGVILRNTNDIANSMRYRRHDDESIHSFVHAFYLLDHIIQRIHPRIILFDKMTTDKEYVYDLLQHFGIYDVEVDLQKTNSKPKKFPLSPEFTEALKKTYWFNEKYGLV